MDELCPDCGRDINHPQIRFMISGSRWWAPTKLIRRVIWRHCMLDTMVVGDCRTGVDAVALEARDEGFGRREQFKADWDVWGKRAGPIRNVAMLDSGVDILYAFPAFNSKGTMHAIHEAAIRRGIPTLEWHWADGGIAKLRRYNYPEEIWTRRSRSGG